MKASANLRESERRLSEMEGKSQELDLQVVNYIIMMIMMIMRTTSLRTMITVPPRMATMMTSFMTMLVVLIMGQPQWWQML